MHGGPPIAAIVLRNVWPFSVTLTGARTLPNTVFGSNVSGMKHAIPSRTIVALNVLVGITFLRIGKRLPAGCRQFVAQYRVHELIEHAAILDDVLPQDPLAEVTRFLEHAGRRHVAR